MLVGVALIVAGMGWWVLRVSALAPGPRSDASGYGQFVLAAVGLAIVIASPVVRMFTSRTALPEAALLDLLATELRRQWDRAAGERGLTDRDPVLVRWRRTTRPVAGPSDVATGTHGLPVRFPGLPGVRMVNSAELDEVDQEGLHEVYGGLASGRLLLIGAAGSGKSSAAILLLRQALRFRDRAAPESRQRIPVPVMVSLHGWDPQEIPVVDWLADELARAYPLLGDHEQAAHLLRDGRLAAFFDGLDEISESLRPEVLRELAAAPFRVVLTTRVDEIEAAAAEMPLPGAVALELQPVAPAAAVRYLSQRCVDPPPPAWRALFDSMRSARQSPVAEALDSPLALSLVYDSYQPSDPVDELLDTSHLATASDIENHLLDRLVRVAYTRRAGHPEPRYDAELAHRTLSYIASMLSAAGTRDLRWWGIDRMPHYAPRTTLLRIIFVLALKCGIVTHLSVQPSRLLLPRLRELLATRTVAFVLIFGLVGGVGAWFALGHLGGVWPVVGPACGAVVGVGATFMIRFGVRREYGTAGFYDPLQTWRNDRNVLLVYSFIGGIAGALIAAILVAGCGFGYIAIAIWVPVGFLAGTPFGAGSASATITAAVFTFAQLSLAKGTPFRLMSFLEDARARHVMRVTGDVYQFRHGKLQERLTQPLS